MDSMSVFKCDLGLNEENVFIILMYTFFSELAKCHYLMALGHTSRIFKLLP